MPGTLHLKQDLPCQDAHAYRVLPDGRLLAAVADGAGTARRAEEGARCATDRAVAWLAAALERPPADEEEWRAAMLGAFGHARDALAEAAAAENLPLREFSATLTCAVATEDRLIVGQIGDGVAVARDGADTLFTTIRPRRGEYANEAAFLTMPGLLDHVEVAIVPRPVAALAITTDGLLRLAVRLPAHDPHPPFFRPLFAFAAEAEDTDRAAADLAAFLASERVGARTDDDKTLVLAARACPSPPSPATPPDDPAGPKGGAE